MLRVLEHLRRTGHAHRHRPDNPRGEARADRIHDGIRVHRVPSRMFLKATSLPFKAAAADGRVLRGFDPHVVHLASPALFGYGGLHAARYLGCRRWRCSRPTWRGSRPATAWVWRRGRPGRGRAICTPAPTAPWRRPPRRSKTLRRIGSRGCITGRAGWTSPVSRRRPGTALRRQWSPEGRPTVGFVGRLAPPHVERLAVLARRDDVQVVIGGRDRPRQAAIPVSQRFSPVRCTARSWPRHTPAWTCSCTGEHETFCQACRRRWPGLPVVIAPDAGACATWRPHTDRAAAAGARIRGAVEPVRGPSAGRTAAIRRGGSVLAAPGLPSAINCRPLRGVVDGMAAPAPCSRAPVPSWR